MSNLNKQIMDALPIKHAQHDCRQIRSGSIISDIGGYYDGQSIVRCEDPSSFHVSFTIHTIMSEGGAGLRVYHCTSEA